jgi:hypothetical protein
MNVQSPCMALARQAEETLPNTTAQTTPMDAIDRHPIDDDVIDIAFEEVRRSVSPEVAEYVFRTMEERNSTKKSQPQGYWTLDDLWSLPNAGPKLMQLTQDNARNLAEVAYNLWNFRGDQGDRCCVHICEIILAWARVLGSRDFLLSAARNLSIAYMEVGRFDDCKALLDTIIEDISSVQSSDPVCDEYRSILGLLHSEQGQHDSAEVICTETMISTRSAFGLAHYKTWWTYYTLSLVLQRSRKSDAQRQLFKEFYNGIYREASSQLLPNLRASLELCETYIDSWMPESRLQRLARKRYVRQSPLGIRERHFIFLRTVLAERLDKDDEAGAVPQIVVDLESVAGESTDNVLTIFAQIISLKIEAIRRLKPSSLRQEALRVIQNLKHTKFLVPIFVSAHLLRERCWSQNFDWETAEHELIRVLENTIIENPSELACLRVQAHERSLESASATAKSNDVHRLVSISGCESAMVVSTADDRLFTGASETDLSFHNRTVMAPALPLSVLAGPQPSSASIPLPDLASTEHMHGFTYPNFLSWNVEPSSFQPLPLAQIPQLSDDARSQNWFSPTVTFPQALSQVRGSEPQSSHWLSPTLTFSQPLVPAQRHQPPDDAPPQNRFSPTMMGTPTSPFTFSPPQNRFSPTMVGTPISPFTFSPPQTPHLFHMSPPARPAGDSPAAALSSDLGSLRGYSISPNLFGTHLSPLRPSSSPASGSSLRSQALLLQLNTMKENAPGAAVS